MPEENNVVDNEMMVATPADYTADPGVIEETAPGSNVMKGVLLGGLATALTATGLAIYKHFRKPKMIERPAKPIGGVLIGRRPGKK